MSFWRRRHPVRDEELSAYLDGQLGQAARARLEAHLEACAACREAIVELRAVRRALGELPRSSAPRSFALREADVRPTATQQPLGAMSRAPALLGGVATAAVLVFGVLVGLDVATEPSEQGPGTASQFAFDVSEGAGEEMLPAEPAAPTLALEAGAPPLAGATAPATGGEGYLDDTAARERPAAPSPESEEAVGAPEEEDGRSRLRVAEAAMAAVALVAGGSLALVWWRRRATGGLRGC